jgi:hypothetical protein
MPFATVKTLDDLDGLSEPEIFEGYCSAERGDPEPGENRGRSFWHGWRCRMMDLGQFKSDDDHRRLVHAFIARERTKRKRA